MPACPNCGQENPEGFAFCGFCTAPLQAQPEPQEVRKTVTLVFSDVTGSTALGEGRDPEAIRGLMNRYFATARKVLERHGGTVEKFVGDAVMAAFGIPVVHEDDALRAVRAALEMQQDLQALNEELQTEFGVRIAIRTGVNTGEVVAGDASTRETFATGDTVNTAARLEQAAPPGEVLLGESTYRLVKDAVRVEPVEPIAAKGKAEPVPSYRLLEVLGPAHVPPRASGTPLVGRKAEIALLHQSFDRAVQDRACQLVTVIGEAGVGKSRLISEFLRSVEDEATVLKGRCLSYGEGISFWPVVEILKQATDIDDSDTPEEARAKLGALVAEKEAGAQIADRVAGLMGLAESAGSIEETFWAVRKVLEATASHRPTVALVEDIHWAEPTLLDLVSHVADLAQGSPLLLLFTARPAFLERHPAWSGDPARSRILELLPLSESETGELMDAVLGTAGVPGVLAERIAAAAQGNPLFLEETLSMLRDEEVLVERNGQWLVIGDLDQISIPPSIAALLEARIDALEAGERDVVGRASVVGKEFERPQVEVLCEERAREGLDPHLSSLTRKEVVVREPTSLEAYSFRHVLIRDAAYRGMSKRLRAELHERLGDHLEEGAAAALTELEEIVGYHLEQAYRYRTQLGPVSDEGTELARRAADNLARAGRRALGRGDVPGAVKLLTRSVALLPEQDSFRLELLTQLAVAHHEFGDLDATRSVLVEAMEGARSLNDSRLEAHAVLARFELQLSESTEGLAAQITEEAQGLVRVFEEHGDEYGLARAWTLFALARTLMARAGEAEEAFQRAIEHARRAGEASEVARITQWWLGFCQLGPTPAAEWIQRCEQILASPALPRPVEAAALMVLSEQRAMSGDFSQARKLYQRSHDINLDLGANLHFAGNSMPSSRVETLAGDLPAAELLLRRAIEICQRMGERGFLTNVQSALGEVAYARGRFDEAERLSEMSEEAAASDDLSAQMAWRTIRAKAVARRGAFEEAERLAREAVAIAGGTDYVTMHAEALVALAEVLKLAGRAPEAVPMIREAIRLSEARGDLASAKSARAMLEELGAPT
jgi:class 3 adenylate cyclase/tetratricopeptide (TPR) repeat protein